MDMATTLDALDGVESLLLELLDSITLAEWDEPTIVPGWRVRHVAAHLLDTASRKLAIVRDCCVTEGPASGSPDDLRDFINRLNADGVRVYGRLSPRVLRTLMAPVSAELCAYQRSVDPMAPAAFAVSWAGESQSANWFDTARELTERWHHQAQIRLALDAQALAAPPGGSAGVTALSRLMTRRLYHPVLDCFIRVLPYAYRHVSAPNGTVLSVRIDGEAGGAWQLVRDGDAWTLSTAASSDESAAAAVVVPEAFAWRLFTKGLSRDAAERVACIEGDRRLALPLLSAVAIVG